MSLAHSTEVRQLTDEDISVLSGAIRERYGQRRVYAGSPADIAHWPEPDTFASAAEFSAGLEAVRRSSGMSYAQLAKVSGEIGLETPRSTLHKMCTSPALPRNFDNVRALLLACRGQMVLDEWNRAWSRLHVESAPKPVLEPAEPHRRRPRTRPDGEQRKRGEMAKVEYIISLGMLVAFGLGLLLGGLFF